MTWHRRRARSRSFAVSSSALALALPLIDAEVLHVTRSSPSCRPSPSFSAALVTADLLVTARRVRRMKPPSALSTSLSGGRHPSSGSSRPRRTLSLVRLRNEMGLDDATRLVTSSLSPTPYLE